MPVYCITGTNRGLGLEFVKQLAQTITNNTIIATAQAGADLGDLHAVASPSTHILECDVSSVSSIYSFVQEAGRILGGDGPGKVDFLLNNAGVSLSGWRNSLALDLDELQTQFTINVVGPAKVVQLLLGADLLSHGVRIINISSHLGSMQFCSGVKPRSYAGYSISKAALNMLTVRQSEDVKEVLAGAVVISMAPGLVKTRMGGEEAVLEPSESIAGMLRTIHCLGSEDTGSSFQYTGEKLAW